MSYMSSAGCLLSDWLRTESLSGIQSSSLRETVMIIIFTSAILHLMFTEIIIYMPAALSKLVFSMLGKNFKKQHFDFLFFPQNRF